MKPPGALWYVIHTQPRGESRAEVNLARQGFTTYMPRCLRTVRHARRTEKVARPLFPRYLFVALDLARDRWRAIQSTFGVCSIVLAGEEPVVLPDKVVEDIRAREDDDGYVRLGLPAGVRAGSPVRLVEGVFADHRGICERVADEARVAILLELLGRQVRVFVPAGSVAAA
jgi:transcriptional antiterminator RfaH